MVKAERLDVVVLSCFAIAACSGSLAAQDKRRPQRRAAPPPAASAPRGDSPDGVLRAAADYLNQIRANPAAHSGEIGADLDGVEARHPLTWNETLATVARNKAEDMARRGYFAHVDPDGRGINIFIHQAGYELIEEFRRSPDQNNFESLGAGYGDALELIRGLIRDDGTPGLGHRRHLLGMDDFWADCTDIGIGHASAPNSQYGNYWVVVIAKHSFTGDVPATSAPGRRPKQ